MCEAGCVKAVLKLCCQLDLPHDELRGRCVSCGELQASCKLQAYSYIGELQTMITNR